MSEKEMIFVICDRYPTALDREEVKAEEVRF